MILLLLLGQAVGVFLSTGHLTIVTHCVEFLELLVTSKEGIRSVYDSQRWTAHFRRPP